MSGGGWPLLLAADTMGFSLRPTLRHRQLPCNSLADHLVRQEEERRGDGQAESPGGVEVNDQLEFRRLLHGQVGRLGSLQNFVDIDGSTYGSPIFKAVQQKWYKALCRALTKSPKSPEYAVGEGSEPSHIDRSAGVP